MSIAQLSLENSGVCSFLTVWIDSNRQSCQYGETRRSPTWGTNISRKYDIWIEDSHSENEDKLQYCDVVTSIVNASLYPSTHSLSSTNSCYSRTITPLQPRQIMTTRSTRHACSIENSTSNATFLRFDMLLRNTVCLLLCLLSMHSISDYLGLFILERSNKVHSLFLGQLENVHFIIIWFHVLAM